MQDFNAMESELKSHSAFITKKMDEMIAKYKESDASEELVTVMSQCHELLQRFRKHILLTMETNFRADQDTVRERESVLADARAMEQSMAEFHEKFLKYNVPKRRDSASFEEYEERLREFMEIWKEEAREGRRKGRRSLLEWLQELGEERASTFEDMKTVAMDLGLNISRILDQYFWFLAVQSEMETVMRILDEVESALECLTVEEGGSIFIDGFSAVVRSTKCAMEKEWVQKCYEKMRKCDEGDSESDEKEMKILRLILREVLRLEVAFGCPDLPMMLTDEVLLSMGSHLRKVFSKTLKRLNSEMEARLLQQLLIDDRDEEMLRHLGEALDSKFTGIWKKLELQINRRQIKLIIQ